MLGGAAKARNEQPNNYCKMDFKDKISNLAERAKKQGDILLTEEATKNALVMPMIIALGYDPFDPTEVVPELDCDLRGVRGEKIDYAIMRNGETAILIEAKHCKQNLNLHDTQLQKYFVASNARFGVLTNGIEYRFYTDLVKTNIMDERPFLAINLLDLSDHDIEQLKKFHKSYFSESEILSTAQQLQTSLAIRQVVNSDFANPSTEFVRYFVKATNNGYYSAKQIEQYTPLVKKEIGNYIDDVISDRLNLAKEREQQPAVKAEPVSDIESVPDNGVVTTQEELDAYNIVRSILRKEVDVTRITYKDYKSYFVVNLDGSWRWICRFYLKAYKYIAFPHESGTGEDKIEIESLDGIFNHSDRLVETLKKHLK